MPKSKFHMTLNRIQKRYNFLGILFAYLFFWASLSPSLMPRSWFLQGITSGVVIVAGYVFGLFFSAAVRRIVRRELPRGFKWYAWLVVGIGGIILSIGQLYLRIVWQREAYAIMQLEQPRDDFITSSICIAALAFIVAYLLTLIIRFVRTLSRRAYRYLLGRKLLNRMPPSLSRIAAGFFIFVVILSFATDTVPSFLLSVADRISSSYNDTFSDEYVQPESHLLSGSDPSLVSWESLGAHGREFVSAGPTAANIADFNQTDSAMEPIRAYVGIDFSNNISAQARIAVRELERTNAFGRKALQIVITTGSGMVDLQSTRPLEYIYNGDIATVAIQYSYLPSWLSFLSDQERAKQAGQELIRQVVEVVDTLPEDARPEVYLFAESLGSFGVEAAFDSIDDLIHASDGTLLLGPPGINPLSREITAERDQGTPQYLPVYNNEQDIVITTGTEWTAEQLASRDPKLIYIQNPSDPIVKWNWGLLWKEPSWVKEQKRDGLLARQFHWYPILTFFQLSADMLIANKVPPGYGHNYGTHAIAAWVALTGAEDWDQAKINRLQRELEPR